MNTAREQLESGDVLTTGHHNLDITAHGVVDAGESDGFRFDVLGSSGTLYVDVRFGEDGSPSSIFTTGGEVEVAVSQGFDLAGTGLVGSRNDLIAMGSAEPDLGAAPRVLLWRSAEAQERPHQKLSEGDRERLRSLGYLE